MEALGRRDGRALERESEGERSVTSYEDSLHALVEQMRRKGSELLDLLTAQTDDEFEAAFEKVLDFAVRHLEKNKTNFQQLDEVGLSGVLAGALSMPGLLTVIQE